MEIFLSVSIIISGLHSRQKQRDKWQMEYFEEKFPSSERILIELSGKKQLIELKLHEIVTFHSTPLILNWNKLSHGVILMKNTNSARVDEEN